MHENNKTTSSSTKYRVYEKIIEFFYHNNTNIFIQEKSLDNIAFNFKTNIKKLITLKLFIYILNN